MNGGGLATGPPDPPQSLFEVGRGPAGADECGAGISTVEIVQGNAYAARPQVCNDHTGLVRLKGVDVALAFVGGLVASDNRTGDILEGCANRIDGIAEVHADENTAAFRDGVLGKLDECRNFLKLRHLSGSQLSGQMLCTAVVRAGLFVDF